MATVLCGGRGVVGQDPSPRAERRWERMGLEGGRGNICPVGRGKQEKGRRRGRSCMWK